MILDEVVKFLSGKCKGVKRSNYFNLLNFLYVIFILKYCFYFNKVMVVFVFFLCVSLKYSYIYDVLFVNIKKGNYEV